MLDSFYDLEDAETAAKNSADIDSSAFDVAASASEVIAKTPLPGLISYASNLDADVKSLDRDMQDLVYNNYSKFIGATETIRRMKDRCVQAMRESGGRGFSTTLPAQRRRNGDAHVNTCQGDAADGRV